MTRRAPLGNDGHQKGGRRPYEPDREVQGKSFRRPQLDFRWQMPLGSVR